MPIDKGMSSFSNLIARDAIFRIPTYQRHYSWERKHLEDLWSDLFYLNPEKRHYFGTILLRDVKQRKKMGLREFEIYEIIDGQQRTVTATILLKAILSRFEGLGDVKLKEYAKREKERYLKFEDIYKLELLGDDERFFREHIIDEKAYPDEIVTLSQKRLKEAMSFFQNQVGGISDPGVLEGIKLKIDSMEILAYPVEEESEASRIFTVVNDRGKPLTNLEKTKSFLMYLMYLASKEDSVETNLRKINERFSRIFRCIVNLEERSLSEEDAQRYHFVTYENAGEITKAYQRGLILRDTREKASANYMEILKQEFTRLYRDNREKYVEESLRYVEDLEVAFFALRELITYKEDDEIGNLLNKIFHLGRVGNFHPMLMASWARYKNDQESLRKILRVIETFIFRAYAICKTRPYAGRSKLYDLAYKVPTQSFGSNDLVKELTKVVNDYAGDDYFAGFLSYKDFYQVISSRDIKYLLFEYETSLRNVKREPLDIQLSQILSETYEVEHIWPFDTSKLGLTEQEIKDHALCKHMLGNLTLASQSWNSSMGNKPFVEKKEAYKDSSLRVQRELTSYEKWGKDQIEQRGTNLLKFASEQWKI
jgi:uncharacterized protein with ParB-like and HNH nuclease domain